MTALAKALLVALIAFSALDARAENDWRLDRGGSVSDNAVFIGMAKDFLEQRLRHLHPELSRVETTAVGHPKAIGAALAAARVVPRLDQDDTLTKRVCVWLDFYVEERAVKSIPVWFSVAAYRQVLVARRALRPNELAGADDFILSEMDVTTTGKPALSSVAEVTAKRARRYIPINTPVSPEDFATPPPVMRHQEVSVQVMSGPIVIETMGVSQEDGWIGQVIQVKNPANDATYPAKVAKDGHVQALWR